MPSERVQRHIDSLLDEIEAASREPDWRRVRELCDSVLRLDPENEDARFFLEAAERDTGESASDAEPSATGTGGASDGARPAASSSVGAAAMAADGGQAGASASSGDRSVAASSSPTSFAAGRYVVDRFLGEGGKKRVFLAHDETLDRDVAFALIKTEGLDETSRERVRREAQAMGRMGTHPAIMPIYDLGEEPVAGAAGTQPYMVQPLMAGGDVEGLIEEAEGPLELETALRIATQTAQGLSFAHSKGIVHRDLKPGNVWLDEDGSAKIGDFGLAVATDRSRLTVEKVMVGTVSYMPPEQATGGEVTPKADLYSLGAMLYEMCTGRVPFMGDDDIAVISQHINTPPVAPSWHNGQVPKTLDSLILRLMSKDPSERPESADEVLAALEAVDLSAAADDAEEREAGLGSLDSMAGGVFVGRHREMDQLKATFEEVLSGRGKMVTLVGEPGIGKTRTAQELSTYASMRGAQVLWGRSYEGGGAPPYWPWVQAIRSHVSATESQELRSQLGSAGPVIAEIVADIREKLPDLPAPTPIEDPESARFRLFDSISTFLKQASQNAPLVLMLEDLHWADRPSLMLLEFVARELANSKLMIVGNYRDVELNRRHPLAVTLGELTRERLFERVVLRGLQRHDVERFIEIAAGITPPAALVDTVHSQTEGNPLFVTETVRLLIQEGDIASGQTTASGTTSWEVRIPEGVREVIGRRLDRLSERCNEVLTTAAVIGRQFRFAVLLKLVGGDGSSAGNGSGSSAAGSGSAMSPPDSGSSSPTSSTTDPITENMLLDALDEALDGRIIEELPEEIGLYQFTHAQMQETLTSELSANRLVRMHARIAEALEEHYGDESEEHAAELVEHFTEAETVLGVERLLRYCEVAGSQLLEAGAFSEALPLLDRVRRADGIPEIRQAEVSAALSRVHAALLQPNAAATAAQHAYGLFVENDMQLEAIEVVGYPYPVTVLYRMQDTIEEAFDAALPGSIQRAKAAIPWAFVQWSRKEYSAAIPLLEEATLYAESIGDESLRARSLSMTANVAGFAQDFQLGVDSAQIAVSLAKSTADYPSEMRARLWLSHCLGMGVSASQSRDEAEVFLDRARRFRDNTWITRAIHPAARAAALSGDWTRACELSSEWRDLSPSSLGPDFTDAICGVCTGDEKVAARAIHRLLTVDPTTSEGVNWSLLAATGVWGAIETGCDTDLILACRQKLRSLAVGFPQTTAVSVWAELESSEDTQSIAEAAEALKGRSQFDLGLDSTDAYRAKFNVLLGKTDEAIDDYLQAIDLARRTETIVPLAWSLASCADLLLDRNAPGDREKAVELQDEAIAIARELGMKPLLERVLAKREIMRA